MTQYINKDALVVELNRIIAELIIEEGENTMFEQGKISAFEDVKLFLDTLEVKEVNSTDAFIEKACESFCKAVCNGHPPRSTCTSLGTCKTYDNFVKAIKVE